MTKYIFVAGGVISGVGKGVITASLGKILKMHGYNTTLIKIDPYINYDAGTLRPTEHGEVWVTHDGGEMDQDLGTYERFIDTSLPKHNSITTGQIYKSVIDNERQGVYLGQTVQFLPHIVDEVKQRMCAASQGYDFAVIELGGTVGDYENIPYLYAIKSLERELGAQRVAYVLVTYLPIPGHLQEMKTKPTQQAIRLLGQEGIWPDFVICRGAQSLDSIRKKKIELCVNIPAERIISAPDLKTIYDMPLFLEHEGVGKKVLDHFGSASRTIPDWEPWKRLVNTIKEPKKSISIAIVGKYLATGDYHIVDSYVSVYHALVHAGAHAQIGVTITWLDAQRFDDGVEVDMLEKFDGVIIPGGFGATGIEGKIKVIEYVRMHNIPYLGICYGMQLAVIEYARSVVGLADAHTTEIDADTTCPIIDVLPYQKKILQEHQIGGTMRLGNFTALLNPKSRVAKLYSAAGVGGRPKEDSWAVSERHRHRYEVNPVYVKQLEEKGLIFSGYHEREDGTRLMEFLELSNHPFFIATQAHPEFNSRLESASPLFYGFVQAARDYAFMQTNASIAISKSVSNQIGYGI